MKNQTLPLDNTTAPKTVRDKGDMFPKELEFIDDADVVTLPDGSTTLVTDAPSVTGTPVKSGLPVSQV